MNKSGIDNLKEQVLSFVSLNKKITRLEFLIYGGVAFALFIFLSYHLIYDRNFMYCFTPDSYIHCEEDDMVLAISFLLLMLLSVGYFTILSIQRLNDLNLSKWLSVIVVQGAFSSLISMLSHGSVWYNIDDFVNMPLIYVLIFISAIFTVFLLLFRGVQSE